MADDARGGGARRGGCSRAREAKAGGRLARADGDERRRRGTRTGAPCAAHRRWRLRRPEDPAEGEEARLMAIIVDNDTRLVVQGLTGREGSFHGVRNRDYGT